MGLTLDQLTEDQANDLYSIASGLIALTEHQAEGARNLPLHLQSYDREDFIRAALGMFVEWGELVNEAQWKPWRQYSEPTDAERARVVKEFGDVLHMLAWALSNLRVRFDIGPTDVAAGFMAAHLENIRRFRGEVPGREPPPPEPSVDPKHAILLKVAEILVESGEGEAAARLRDYTHGRNTEGVAAWLLREAQASRMPTAEEVEHVQRFTE